MSISPRVVGPVHHGNRLLNLDTSEIGAVLHYLQEDQPQAIGEAIAAWMRRHSLASSV